MNNCRDMFHIKLLTVQLSQCFEIFIAKQIQIIIIVQACDDSCKLLIVRQCLCKCLCVVMFPFLLSVLYLRVLVKLSKVSSFFFSLCIFNYVVVLCNSTIMVNKDKYSVSTKKWPP